ncbi:MAG: DNA polymerase III subunit gamma/tau C-terminal domain-containing protein, partial [Natronospirillum sp.]
TPDFNRVVKSPPAPPVAEPDHTTGVSDSAVTELADTAYPPQSDPTPSDSAPSNPAPSDLTPATIADAVEAPAPSAPVELDVAAEPVVPVEEDAGEAPPPWDPEPVAAETVEADLPSAVELLSDLEVASSSPATTTPDLAEPASDNSVQFHPDTLRALDAVSDDLDALQDHWLALIPALELSGVMANLVRHSAVHSCADGQIVLAVAPEYEPIYQVEYRHRVAESLQALDFPVEDVKIEFTDPGEETLHQREQRVRREAYRVARASLEQDAVVQTLIQELDGELLADTVEPSPGSQL